MPVDRLLHSSNAQENARPLRAHRTISYWCILNCLYHLLQSNPPPHQINGNSNRRVVTEDDDQQG